MHLLIDLDGTLVDPAAGILASVEAGLRAVGITPPGRAELAWVIGPPLRQSFPQLGVSDVDTAIAAYRANYNGGAMLDAAPYPGVHEALDALRADGHTLHVATSKPHVFATRIIAHFDFASRFTSVHGPELDGTRDDKGDLLAHLLQREGIAASDALMLGDRMFDGRAAARHGLPFLGVLWGYGTRAELEANGAVALASRWSDVPGLIAEGVPPRQRVIA
jgi:phosphoglycolate phosphatase